MICGGFLNSEQRKELEQIVRRPAEDHCVARRASAILLLDDGKSCSLIAEFLYLNDDTIREWHKNYMSGGFDALVFFDWHGGTSRLSRDQEKILTSWLENRFCSSTNEIRRYIDKTCHVRYSHSGCIKLLHRLGFDYKKPRPLPAVANEVQQQDFIDYYEDLQRMLPEDEAIYFADAVHP